MLQPKRLISLLLALVLVSSLLPAAAFAQDTCAHEWKWDEDEGPFFQTCALCDEEQTLDKITGPYEGSPVYWTLTPDGTMTVSGEGEFHEDYFYGDDLPEGQLCWEPYAPYITTLVVEEGITYFYGTPDLTGLTAAHFPASLEDISASKVLRGSLTLTTVTVAVDNLRYCTVDNVLFDRENNVLLFYPRGKTDSSYTVHGCSIGSYAFYNNSYLESLVVEEGAVSLAGNAISRCENLTELSLPASLEEVWASAIPDSVETIYYAGSETMWNRVYLHPDNDLSGVEMVFGMPKSDILPQWKNAHTLLQLKGEAEDAALVVVSFYHSDGHLVKSLTYSPAQVAAGVTITDNTVDLSACSAKIMVVNQDFAPVYDYTVPEGDVDPTTTAVFEGWLYEMSEMELDSVGAQETRPGELRFFDGEQSLVLDSAGVSTPGYLGLGQKYIVTYNVQTNDLISMESAGVSEVGTARLDEVEWVFTTVGNAKKYLFTFGGLEDVSFDGDIIPRMDMDAGCLWLSPAEMRDLTGSPCADEYTAVDKDGDGDIDCLLVRPVQYGRVAETGTSKTYGDYMALQIAGEHANQTTRYYLEELDGPAKLPDDLEEGDIVKLTCGFERSETGWEVLPSASMTLEEVLWKNGECVFDDRTFTAAQNGWDLTDILIEDKVGDPFTVTCDGDLLVWAEADVIPLDAAEIYTDGDEIDPEAKDAVELMYALGLMGAVAESPEPEELVLLDAAGSFNPNGTFTRAEMARLAYLILHSGDDDGAVNYKGTSTFSDVEADAWYEGYINYCTANKLIHGKSDGTFAPDEPVTCAKAAKMLLIVIGYDAEDRGYVGDGWEHQVLADASILGLLEGYKANTADPAPRQWLAKMVENCLLKCTDAKNIPMGEKYFGLTEDSETYRSVYPETPEEPEEPASTSLTMGNLPASQTMSFADELTAFKNLGGNSNAYITIDTLPTHGRLVYNLGTAQQEEVEAGKYYYLTSASGKLQLSKVTYVPAYSADKTPKADTFAVTGFSAEGNKVKGTVTINIQYAQTSVNFTDVTDSYYADSVDFVYNQKISTGMTTTTFGLTGGMTRGQFVTFLYRAAGSPAVTDATNNFTDVSASDYYYKAVMWAVRNSLVSGTTATTFAPTDRLTREQALTFLYRLAVNYLGRDGTLGSTDGITDYADVDAWAQTPVRWAAGHGFIGDGALEPKATLDRGTTALYLHGALTGIAGSTGGGTPAPDPEPTPDPEPVARTVLAYAISATTASGALEVQVIGPDGEQDALFVTEVDGEAPSVTGFALPAFYQAAENTDGEASLTHITRDFKDYSIYAGTVTKYTYKTSTVTLNSGTQLTESADGFTLYDGNLDVESDALEDVTRKTNYIFYAPDKEAVYGIRADKTALEALFVRLGGLDDSAAKYGDSYFIHPEARDAVAFLYDIDLMLGDVGGNFNPESPVPRAVLANMIYEILHYGEDDRGADYTDLNLFTDVASGDWYAGYVNYCADMGLMSGNADGTFAPYDTVTCPQAAKILLMALGYDAEARGYVGANWDKNVLSDAAILGLLDGYEYNVNTVAPRQWLAVMLANALRNCYTYTGDDPVRFTTLVTKEMAAADRKRYILTGDKYYDLGLDPEPELVLLTDAYCGTKRDGKVYAVDALLDGEIMEVNVNTDSDYTLFIDDSNMVSSNSWGLLIPYAGDEKATTNVAAYTLDDDGMMHLYQTEKTFIDLYEEDLKSSETAYSGDYTDENGELFEDIRVQASRNTVFCYADDEGNVFSVTGYKKSYAVTDAQHGIRAVYAVATEIPSESEDPFFVADMIVIETETPVNLPVSEELVVVYDQTTVKDSTEVSVIAADGTQKTVPVTQVNGKDAADSYITLPAFYDYAEYSNGDISLTTIKYPTKRDVVTGRVESFAGDDVLLHDGTQLTTAAEGFILYDSDYAPQTAQLTDLYQKELYLFYAPDGEAVYGVHVPASLRDLYKKAGGTLPEANAATLYLDGDTIEPALYDAVELMYELGLMESYGKGYFHPKATFTRAHMAKLIYVLLNYGHDDKAINYRGANFFSDVASGAWYEGYVNYCAATKLIQGEGDGTFGPDEPVTCAKAAKMLLTAIGYSAEARGYTPDTENWEANVLSDAAIIGLLDDYTYSTTAATPRQWVAKLVENCLLKCYTYDKIPPAFSGLLPGNTGTDYILMGEKYFDLTEDSEVYKKVYGAPAEPQLVLGYNVVNKTTEDYISLDTLSTDCTEDVLAVTQLDGENAKDAVFDLPAFYEVTETADGDASLTSVNANYADYGIYAVTVERVNTNYGYVVTTDGEDFECVDGVPVYHLYDTSSYTKLTTEDDNDDTLTLQAGSSYILYTENGEVVLALLVEDGADIAAALYTRISGKALPSEPQLVLGYNVVNKTVTDYISLDILTTDCTEDVLAVTQLDGENAKDAVFDLPAFYEVTETADGDASLTSVNANYADYGIYAVTVDRVNDLNNYIVTTDGDDFECVDGVPVYHLYDTSSYTKLTTEDDNDKTLTLQAGSSYILYVENGEVVLALLVESGADIAAALFTAISGRTLEQPVDPDQQTAEQIAASLPNPLTVEVEQPTAEVLTAAITDFLLSQNDGAAYQVYLPDYSFAPGAGQITLEEVKIVVQVGEATASTSLSVTVLYSY